MYAYLIKMKLDIQPTKMEIQLTKEQAFFHEAFWNEGGLANPLLTESMWGFNRKSFDLLYQRLSELYPAIPPILFDFVNSDALNAYAGLYQNSFFIGLNVSSCHMLLDVFSKMLSNRAILPDIGNAAAETDEEKKLDIHPCKEGICYDHASSTTRVVINDRTRRWYSSICTAFSYEYVVLHEFGHIVRGHSGYQGSIKNAFFQEFGTNNINHGLPFSVRQALEIDADLFALHFALMKADQLIKTQAMRNQEYNPYKDWDSFVFCYVFSLYIFFRLRFDQQVEPDTAKECTHPPAQMRIAIHTEVLAQSLLNTEDLWGSSIEARAKRLQDIFTSAINEAEKAFHAVTFQTDDRINQVYAHYWETPAFHYKREVLKTLENLYPVIQPFAFTSFERGIRVSVK